MTTDDVKRQKGDVLLAYQEADEKLALLRHKAKNASETLATFARLLEGSPERNIFGRDQAHHGFPIQDYTPQKYIDALEPKQYFQLADDIRQAEVHLKQLRELKDRLGLK